MRGRPFSLSALRLEAARAPQTVLIITCIRLVSPQYPAFPNVRFDLARRRGGQYVPAASPHAHISGSTTLQAIALSNGLVRRAARPREREGTQRHIRQSLPMSEAQSAEKPVRAMLYRSRSSRAGCGPTPRFPQRALCATAVPSHTVQQIEGRECDRSTEPNFIDTPWRVFAYGKVPALGP
ncbi:hypothetical protein CC85DRAFT_17085 [Cutaneotrichosporon oleaginosum]|uniref:Uncharacterized protein n=1 Tax=Cutaneotrichosporon oleaginosum TaxID=879819 RepID=A0A0J0XTJ2_9TREE|nr:uncharacterized protein CC85DRAFT_17085 [Cutaneotrichosporon oleaginosum]KLT44388.1 hypothetical protein CC85DRAFT_17085 [Cutaneotrichosporon oleaginosum]TXT07889.1 hypothetical protein COLE_04813 [Cutaneotrichosporon oleaginosum]